MTVPTITIAAKMSQGNKKLRRFFTAPQTNKAERIPPRISPNKEKTNTYVLYTENFFLFSLLVNGDYYFKNVFFTPD